MSNIPAMMMWCEIRHLGGLNPTKRIFNKCGTNPSLDSIMDALRQDQNDSSSNNQVGDKVYWSRHECCYKWIKQYAKNQGENKNMGVNFNNYTNKISNSGHDENGNYNWGAAGDQTGTEWQIVNWYSRPWNVVLRHPNTSTANLIAELAIEAADNDNIGYDQSERYTFWDQLKRVGYHPANITTKCEADCSAGVAAIVKAVGYLTGDGNLQAVNSDSYTGNLRAVLTNAGFQALTDSKYLISSNYLKPGDVLLYEGHHTAINIGIGSNSDYSGDSSSGVDTKTLQSLLNSVGWDLDTDNSYGSLTTQAVIDFQTMYGLEVNGQPTAETIDLLNKLVKIIVDNKFDAGIYDQNYPDLSVYNHDARKLLLHYYVHGKKEGRNCSTLIQQPKPIASASTKKTTTKQKKTADGIPLITDGKYKKTPVKVGKVTGAARINVRQGPDQEKYTNITNWPILQKDNLIDVCSAVKNDKKQLWYYIKIAGKYYGFVRAKYITFNI